MSRPRLTQKSLRRETLAQIDQAATEIAGVDSADDVKIHHMRRRSKRIRALLDLVVTDRPRKTRRAARAVRDASRAVSSLRDTQVIPDAIDSIRPLLCDIATSGQLESLAQTLRESSRADSCEHATKIALAQLRAARKAVAAIPLDGKAKITPQTLAPTYRLARRQLRRVLNGGEAADFHELRKSVKSHYYQCRFAKPLCPSRLDARVGLAKRCGDLLGQVQDAAVIAARCESSTGDSKHRRAVVAACHEGMRRRQEEATAIACQLFFERPSRFVRDLTR